MAASCLGPGVHLSIRVQSGPHCLLTKNYFLIFTFGDLFLRVSQDHRIGKQSTINKVIMSDQPRNGGMEVELGAPVALCVEFSSKYFGAVMCGECQKPRCIYSATKLSDAEANAVEQVKDSNVYTCGSELLSQDLASAVIVRIGITCQSPIETTYYTATHVHFPDACYYCGETDADHLLDDPYIKELKQQFATVRPLCRQCRNAGAKR